MEIKVIRKWPRSKYIMGQMFLDGAFFCHTMEPPSKGEHPCIPAGKYDVEMYPSAKFRGMRPIVLNVPGRSGILIHEGNLPHQTKGCILVGRNMTVGSLSFSKGTLDNLIYRIKLADKTTLRIVEGKAFSLPP